MKEKRKRNLWIAAGVGAGILIGAYIGISVYYNDRFYANTKINGIDFSGKSVADVQKYMKDSAKGYQLTIKELDGKEEVIKGDEIGLKFQDNGQIKKLKKKQNGFLWPKAFFTDQDVDIKLETMYDAGALEQRMKTLNCVTRKDQTEAVNAAPKYDGSAFVIEPEVSGSKIDSAMLEKKLGQKISGYQETLELEPEGCYIKAKYTSESEEVKNARDLLNKYCGASITYDMAPASEVVDRNLISTWVTCDENYAVSLNQDAVAAYMSEFGKKYDTKGKTRPITTPWGKNTEVSGGTYGWEIDEAGETEALTASILAGEVITKQPAYVNTAVTHGDQDWGNTYIEVDLSDQHMWYIVDGGVAFESDVVTGKPVPARQTPAGVYSILERLRNKVLVGNILPETGKPEYETPVDYWARVTYTGIGFHDANWQAAFGGSRYISHGSHGCINMPPSAAAAFYDMIAVGTPVVMHY